MADIRMLGLGQFEYDPTLDDLGKGGYAYVFDGRRLKLRPMEGEDNKVLNPATPYNALVFLQLMTWTGGMEATQLNCHGVYAINRGV
jgi:hypothetical protein